jgi:hypothetical protein
MWFTKNNTKNVAMKSPSLYWEMWLINRNMWMAWSKCSQDIRYLVTSGVVYFCRLAWWLEWYEIEHNCFIRIMGDGVQTGSTWYVGHFWPLVPGPGDCEDGEFGGIETGRGNQSTRRKPAPTPIYPPQIPLDQTQARIRAAVVGRQWLTAWAMERAIHKLINFGKNLERLCIRKYIYID